MVILMVFNDYLGHFRGVSLLNFFWFEPLFLSYKTNNLQKKWILVIWPYPYLLNYWFLWFLMIIWVILGGFRSWTFFDWSVCFWVTGQIIWKKVIFFYFDPICIFLTIDFCENLQEYFFCLKSIFGYRKWRK